MPAVFAMYRDTLATAVMNGVKAEPTPNRNVDIVWPLSMRW